MDGCSPVVGSVRAVESQNLLLSVRVLPCRMFLGKSERTIGCVVWFRESLVMIGDKSRRWLPRLSRRFWCRRSIRWMLYEDCAVAAFRCRSFRSLRRFWRV